MLVAPGVVRLSNEERRNLMVKRNSSIIAAFLVGFTIAMFVATAVGTVGVYYAKDFSRQSYARGMYDLCVTLAVNYFSQPPIIATKNCLRNISEAMAGQKFYETPSPGFIWPLPNPNPNEG